MFHKGLRLVVRRVYSSQNPRTVRKSRTVRDSVSQRFPVAANCKYVQLTLSKPVRTRLEFSETDLRTVSGYDQFAVNSSQVEFLLRVRTNILVKHPPDDINSPVLQSARPPAVDSGEAKMRTASWENVDKQMPRKIRNNT